MDNILYDGTIFPFYAQLALLDVESMAEGNYPQFQTGYENVLFGPKGVVVATMPDTDVAVTIYGHKVPMPEMVLVGRGEIEVGDEGLVLGTPVSQDDYFPWDPGFTTVSVYANAVRENATRVVFVLEGPAGS